MIGKGERQKLLVKMVGKANGKERLVNIVFF